jgi:hypothetical protein
VFADATRAVVGERTPSMTWTTRSSASRSKASEASVLHGPRPVDVDAPSLLGVRQLIEHVSSV